MRIALPYFSHALPIISSLLLAFFGACRNAIDRLHQYYNNPVQQIEPNQRAFPYLSSFQNDDGDRIYFKYRKNLNPNSLIFSVDVEDAIGLPEQLLVKFTRHYCIKAHKACVRLGIAPELYGFENLAGGWKAVVMACKGDGFKMLFECTLDGKIKA